jgi:hypothetical protein
MTLERCDLEKKERKCADGNIATSMRQRARDAASLRRISARHRVFR